MSVRVRNWTTFSVGVGASELLMTAMVGILVPLELMPEGARVPLRTGAPDGIEGTTVPLMAGTGVVPPMGGFVDGTMVPLLFTGSDGTGVSMTAGGCVAGAVPLGDGVSTVVVVEANVPLETTGGNALGGAEAGLVVILVLPGVRVGIPGMGVVPCGAPVPPGAGVIPGATVLGAATGVDVVVLGVGSPPPPGDDVEGGRSGTAVLLLLFVGVPITGGDVVEVGGGVVAGDAVVGGTGGPNGAAANSGGGSSCRSAIRTSTSASANMSRRLKKFHHRYCFGSSKVVVDTLPVVAPWVFVSIQQSNNTSIEQHVAVLFVTME